MRTFMLLRNLTFSGIFNPKDVIKFAKDFSGGYLLLIYLGSTYKVSASSFDSIILKRGYYIYAGSALRKCGWRLIRHICKRRKKLHWHIDRLLKNPKAKVIAVGLLPSKKKVECILSNHIASMADRSIRGFGSTDCDCPSHLHYFKRKRDAIKAIEDALKKTQND